MLGCSSTDINTHVLQHVLRHSTNVTFDLSARTSSSVKGHGQHQHTNTMFRERFRKTTFSILIGFLTSCSSKKHEALKFLGRWKY